MLKATATLLGFLAAISALLAPLCIIHWLLQLGSAGAAHHGLLVALDPLFVPQGQWLASRIPFLPTMHYQGQVMSLGQGVWALLLTTLFFILSLGAKLLTVIDTRGRIRAEASLRHDRVQAITQEQEKTLTDDKNISSLLILIDCELEKNSGSTQAFLTYNYFNGKLLSQSADRLLLSFSQVDDGLRYIQRGHEQVQEQYAKLRPLEAKPPYRCVLYAIPAGVSVQQGMEYCHLLVTFCQPFQRLCTQSLYRYMVACQLKSDTTSLGVYDLPDQPRQELYQLN